MKRKFLRVAFATDEATVGTEIYDDDLLPDNAMVERSPQSRYANPLMMWLTTVLTPDMLKERSNCLVSMKIYTNTGKSIIEPQIPANQHLQSQTQVKTRSTLVSVKAFSVIFVSQQLLV